MVMENPVRSMAELKKYIRDTFNLSELVCVAFSFEAPMLSRYALSNVFDLKLREICKCVMDMFCVISLTNGMSIYLLIVVFLTYYGASIVILSILFWSACILYMCVFDAGFHITQA